MVIKLQCKFRGIGLSYTLKTFKSTKMIKAHPMINHMEFGLKKSLVSENHIKQFSYCVHAKLYPTVDKN